MDEMNQYGRFRVEFVQAAHNRDEMTGRSGLAGGDGGPVGRRDGGARVAGLGAVACYGADTGLGVARSARSAPDTTARTGPCTSITSA